MDLTPYVDQLRSDLDVAAEAGGDDARALAERLTAPLESATRLMLLNALSAAMAEITRDLAPGAVDVRLRGLDPDFVVTTPPGWTVFEPSSAAYEAGTQTPQPVAVPADSDDGAAARINLRLPAHLKSSAEEAAGREGLSVNAWLVRTVAAAVEPVGERARPVTAGSRHGGQSYTGWVS